MPLAIRADGSLWAWGSNDNGQLGLGDAEDVLVPTQVGTDRDWASVSGGEKHSIALKANGSLRGGCHRARQAAQDAFRCDCDGEFVGFGAVLSWSEGDLATRVFDVLIQQAYEGECYDRMGDVQMSLNTPSAMKTWQHAMRPRFKAIGLIDRLINGLSG